FHVTGVQTCALPILLHIEGVKELGGTEHTLLPDMIEIGSFIGLAAMTQSELTIKDVEVEQLGIIPETFRRMGIKLEIKGNDIYIDRKSTRLNSSHVK